MDWTDFATFLFRRLLWTIVTLWVVFNLSAVLIWNVPGGPFDSEKKVAAEVKRSLERQFQLDQPRWKQYCSWLADTARGDLRQSMKISDYTVNEIIAQTFPVSATLGIFALVFAISLGLTAGMLSAVFRHSIWDTTCMAVATIGIAVPNFVLASLAIMVLVFFWGLFPAGGWGSVKQVILPALCLGAPFAGYIARLTRTSLLEVLGLDYVRTARAKGLSPFRVICRHALRGALLPVVSYLGPASAGILTGSVVLERIFAIPGMATFFIDAALQKDYTLSMGMIMVYTCLLLAMNLVVDVSYAILDPRVKLR